MATGNQSAAFLHQLAHFLATQGIMLQAPILGRQKLDYYRIYEFVIDAGGYEKVTADKGWGKITTPFNFPDTSAHVVKSCYQKYLLGWEQVKFWGKDVKDVVFEPDRKQSTDRRPRPNVAPPRIAQYPNHRPHPRPMNPPPDVNREDYLMQGGNQSRILLAIESRFENEIEWALLKLVKYSYQCAPTFHINLVPGLLEALISLMDPFFNNLKLNATVGNFTTTLEPNSILPGLSSNLMFNLTAEQDLQFETVLRVLHILRNFSFNHPNAQFFSTHHDIISLIAKGVALPESSHFIAIRQDCLGILENASGYITVRASNDFFITCLRNLILSALRILRQLCSLKANRPVFIKNDVNPTIFLERCMTLLLAFKDIELVSAVLDYLYEFTSICEESCKRLCSLSLCTVGNPVRFLSRFIRFEEELVGLLDDAVALKTGLSKRKRIDMPPPPISLPGSFCMWGNCVEKFGDDAALVAHVRESHIMDESLDEGIKCEWKSCGIHALRRPQAFAHLLTHYPLSGNIVAPVVAASKSAVASGASTPMVHTPTSSTSATPASSVNGKPVSIIQELNGIPLTALLLIRNLAKYSVGLNLLELDFAVLGCDPRYSKFMCQILVDIDYERQF